MTITSKLHRGLIVASMIGTGSTVLATTEAHADALCGSRAALLAKIAQEFGENPVAIGLASNGGVVELLSSQSGSWTLIITFATPPTSRSEARTCLIATGEGWQAKDPAPQVAGRPA